MPNVEVRPISSAKDLVAPDAIIIPGTKNTTWDLDYLRRSGIERAIIELSQSTLVFGICGGFQMLGRELRDPLNCESDLGTIRGMNLMNFAVEFQTTKTVVQRSYLPSSWNPFTTEGTVHGYEVHSGRVIDEGDIRPLYSFEGGYDGAVHPEKAIFGTFVHDLFRNPSFVHAFINFVRARKGLPRIENLPAEAQSSLDSNLDRIAKLIQENWNIRATTAF